MAIAVPLTRYSRMDPEGRSFAHPVLISKISGETGVGIGMEHLRCRELALCQGEHSFRGDPVAGLEHAIVRSRAELRLDASKHGQHAFAGSCCAERCGA